MAKQHPLPRYAIHAINDAKLNIVPRFDDKEIEIYLYETNQSIRTINESKATIIIQAKLKQILKFRYSSQSTEISTRRFENPADTAYWLNQLQGYIYERLNINPNMYSYLTIYLDTQETIKHSPKFRVIRNNETISASMFRWSEIVAVQESIKSFPSFDKSDYNLVNEIRLQDKISRIDIELDNNAQISYKGIQIFTKEKLSNTLDNHNLINKVQATPENCCLTFINILQTEPLLTNYLSWQHFLDYSKKEYDKKHDLVSLIFIRASRPGDIWFKNLFNSYSLNLSAKGWLWTSELFVPEIDYFTSDRKNIYDWNWDGGQNFKGNSYKWNKSLEFVKDFLNGQAIEPKTNLSYLEIEKDKYQVVDKIIKLEDLDQEKIEHRKYFVLGKNLNLLNEFNLIECDKHNFDESSYFQWKNTKQKFNFLNSQQWKNKLKQENVKYELFLTRQEYSPRISINQKESLKIKFTLWNEENEKVFEGTFNTNNRFKDSDFRSLFQF